MLNFFFDPKSLWCQALQIVCWRNFMICVSWLPIITKGQELGSNFLWQSEIFVKPDWLKKPARYLAVPGAANLLQSSRAANSDADRKNSRNLSHNSHPLAPQPFFRVHQVFEHRQDQNNFFGIHISLQDTNKRFQHFKSIQTFDWHHISSCHNHFINGISTNVEKRKQIFKKNMLKKTTYVQLFKHQFVDLAPCCWGGGATMWQK